MNRTRTSIKTMGVATMLVALLALDDRILETRGGDTTQGVLDTSQNGSRVTNLLGGLDQDAQTLADQPAVKQGLSRSNVPEAGFNPTSWRFTEA